MCWMGFSIETTVTRMKGIQYFIFSIFFHPGVEPSCSIVTAIGFHYQAKFEMDRYGSSTPRTPECRPVNKE